MSRAERLDRTWRYINENPRSSTAQVMNGVGSSIDTTRKDIQELRRQGRVTTEVEQVSGDAGGLRLSWHTAKIAPICRWVIMSNKWTPEELGRAL